MDLPGIGIIAFDYISCLNPFKFFPVLYFTGPCDHIIPGHSYPNIKIAEFTIEFPLIQIRHRMPSFSVKYCRLGVPLCYLESLSIISPTGKIERKLYVKRCCNQYLLFRKQRFWQNQLTNIYVLWMIFRFLWSSVNFKVYVVDITLLFFI